ncbi:MAG: T9SS type A sorting domain-containing protein, partial [Bacteroidia bacterium]|nr:T9SS type A sorting domain-containing protein [Bacteroidia bacterium]
LTSAGTNQFDRFKVELNNSLINFEGLENLTELAAFWINGNNSLQSLQGLNNLTEITVAEFNFWGTPLTNLVGLDNLTTISGQFGVIGNENMIDFTGLQSLTTVGGGLDVIRNEVLQSFQGLTSLNSISNFYMNRNYILPNLNGLEGVTSLNGGQITVAYENDNFTSLSGIDNIDHTTIGFIDLTNIPTLSECAIRSICDYLNGSNPEFVIYGNAPGCSDVLDILDQCENLSVGDPLVRSIRLYPNPTDQYFRIESRLPILNVKMYSILGELIDSFEYLEQYSMDQLQDGVYFVRIETEYGVKTTKVLKK